MKPLAPVSSTRTAAVPPERRAIPSGQSSGGSLGWKRGRQRQALVGHHRAGPVGIVGDQAIDAQSDERGHLRSEEHTPELQSLMRISYAVFCWKKKITPKPTATHNDL